MPRLKVFCTTSGFHDSIVAAPSKPAALKAWGAKTDLFSMGAARLVTDPRIARKALDRPGEVIRLRRSGDGEEAPAPARKSRRKAKVPNSARLRAAQEKLAALDAEITRERDRIDRELKAIEARREQLLKRHAKARATAELKVERAREAYDAALAAWQG